MRTSSGDYIQIVDYSSITPDATPRLLTRDSTGASVQAIVHSDGNINFGLVAYNVSVYTCDTCVDVSSGKLALATRLFDPLVEPLNNFTMTNVTSPISGSWAWDTNTSAYIWTWTFGADWGHAIPVPQPLLPPFSDGAFIRLQVNTGDYVAECTNCVGVTESTVYQAALSIKENVFLVAFGSNYPLKVGLIAWNGNYLAPDAALTSDGPGYYKTLVDANTPYYWDLTVQASTITLFSAERSVYLGSCSTCFSGQNIVAGIVGLTGTSSASLFAPSIETSAVVGGSWVYDFWANTTQWVWTNGGGWGTSAPSPSTAPALPINYDFPYTTGQFVSITNAGKNIGICSGSCSNPLGVFASNAFGIAANVFEV